MTGLSLSEYATELASSGVKIVGRTDTEFWMGYESWALMRMPAFLTGEPEPRALSSLLRASGSLVATYLVEPDDAHSANGWLYVCRDPDYSVEKLDPAVRRNVRRGLRELRIHPVPQEQLVEKGYEAFRDTRERGAMSDGTLENLMKWSEPKGKYRSHSYLGAWAGDTLAAFLSITAVDDWAEIEGCYSANFALSLRPNDTLMAVALHEYLVNRRSRLVSYGLSSIQAETSAAGLHRFKTKVGFEALPVHRTFVVHPFARHLVNGFSHGCLRMLLSLAPRNRLIKKAEGVLAAMLRHTGKLPALVNHSTP
jgi:hypothetical protein